MGEAAAKEPTMEDILSSIRKIIAEEGDSGPGEHVKEPNLDSPVEVAKEESPSSLQQLAKKMAEPESSQPATSGVEPKPAEPSRNVDAPTPEAAKPAAMSSSAGSLADIAASLKAKETTPAVEAPKHEMESPAAPVPAAERLNAGGKPTTNVEMANAVPAPKAVPDLPPQGQKIETPPKQETSPASSTTSLMQKSSMIEESEFKGALMSPSSNTSVSDSFDRLKRSVMDDLEAKTEAVLRPMLREWLDENLPIMVERLVREEIERVARGM
ncbi:MAG: DUF2497 domain-containing protein [Pseudomonadota bacterium]